MALNTREAVNQDGGVNADKKFVWPERGPRGNHAPTLGIRRSGDQAASPAPAGRLAALAGRLAGAGYAPLISGDERGHVNNDRGSRNPPDIFGGNNNIPQFERLHSIQRSVIAATCPLAVFNHSSPARSVTQG